MALITYCQKELGPISKMFTKTAYQREITVDFEASELSEENDPFGLTKARIIGKMKQAATDNLAYEKSKTRLYGIRSSMTTKEVDEKLSVHRSTIDSESLLPPSDASATPTAPFVTQTSRDTAFVNCPLSLWKDVVHVVTTKTAGNKRIDQDKITVEFATRVRTILQPVHGDHSPRKIVTFRKIENEN